MYVYFYISTFSFVFFTTIRFQAERKVVKRTKDSSEMRWSHMKHPRDQKKDQKMTDDAQINKMRNISIKWGIQHIVTVHCCFLLVWTISRWPTDPNSCFSSMVFSTEHYLTSYSQPGLLSFLIHVRYRSIFIFQFFRECFNSALSSILSMHKSSCCLSWITQLCVKNKTNDTAYFLFACS